MASSGAGIDKLLTFLVTSLESTGALAPTYHARDLPAGLLGATRLFPAYKLYLWVVSVDGQYHSHAVNVSWIDNAWPYVEALLSKQDKQAFKWQARNLWCAPKWTSSAEGTHGEHSGHISYINITNITNSMSPPPDMSGFTKAWTDAFSGAAGTLPSSANWAIETPLTNNNGEQQKYTNSTQNVYQDGNGQLIIAPVKTTNGTWTSARIHGKQSIACDRGKKLIVSSRFRTGQTSSSQQQGIWPAFWTLGDSINHGVQWPTCCEWDIFEWGNGKPLNQGTLHQTGPTGTHDQQSGFAAFDHSQFHTWAVVVDLTSDDYTKQALIWTLDGGEYWRVNGMGGSDVQRACWERCAHQAFFTICNVAVGGNFVGDPGAQTMGGADSGLTFQWVAIYKST